MWQFIVRLILRNRATILIIIALLTIFMGWQGSKIQMSYEMARMLPKDNEYSIEYDNFKKQFGQDGSVLFIAIQDTDLFTLDHFNKWYDLNYDILEMNLPSHSYTFLKKDGYSEFIHPEKLGYNKNDRGLLSYVKNDVFGTRPNLDSIYNLL